MKKTCALKRLINCMVCRFNSETHCTLYRNVLQHDTITCMYILVCTLYVVMYAIQNQNKSKHILHWHMLVCVLLNFTIHPSMNSSFISVFLCLLIHIFTIYSFKFVCSIGYHSIDPFNQGMCIEQVLHITYGNDLSTLMVFFFWLFVLQSSEYITKAI